MKFIVSRRLNSGERGDCPDTLAPSPPSLANRSFCRMVGGVSRRISEASDIRVTIRIAGEFGVDGDKAWHRIECVYVCVFPLFPSISPCSIAQRGSSFPLFPERAVCAAPTFKLIQRTYMDICVCVYAWNEYVERRGVETDWLRVYRPPNTTETQLWTLWNRKDLRGRECSTRLLIEPFREGEERVVVEVTPLRALIKICERERERGRKVRSG